MNGTKTEFFYAGSQLCRMKRGSEMLTFSYDSLGPWFVAYNGGNYYYMRNAQGDVMGLVNYLGQLVVSYTYDA